jgi:type II secretory pathway component HofQ
MLKKVLKAVAKLQAKAKTNGAASLDAGSSLTKKLRTAIADLDARAKDHDFAAELARDAARQLRQLLAVNATKVVAPKPALVKPVAKAQPAKLPRTVKPKSKTAPVKEAGPVKKAGSTSTPAATAPKALTTKAKPPIKPAIKRKAAPTLADAIQHVLKSRQGQNAGAVKARQLHGEVQQAGYRFGGNNVENQMNYLHKTLRQHATRFKRAADGTIALA